MSGKDLLLFGTMIALFAFLAALGEPIGFVGLIFFGGGGAVYWYLTRVRSGSSVRGARHGTLAGAERHSGKPRGLVPTQRGALAAGAAGSAIFVVAGAYLIVEARSALEAGELIASRSPTGALISGVLAVIFFGILLVALIVAWCRPGGLALLTEGVYCRQPAGSAWLPWASIEEVSVIGVLGQRCLGFRLASAEPAVVVGIDNWLRGWYRRRLGVDLTYVPHGSGGPAELCDAVAFYRSDASAREHLSDPSEAARWE